MLSELFCPLWLSSPQLTLFPLLPAPIGYSWNEADPASDHNCGSEHGERQGCVRLGGGGVVELSRN